MAMRNLLFAALISYAFAAPVEPRADDPRIILENGVVVGSSFLGVDSFRGVPYALTPTGTRRLRPPSPIATPFGTVIATGLPTACPQMAPVTIYPRNLPKEITDFLVKNPLNRQSPIQGEDCLTVNVQRPSTIDPGTKLPVVFWIYGGGFGFGSTSMYDGSGIIQKSVNLGAPIIFVGVNYRVGAFGFLAGKELQADGSTNLGLRDQRLGLQWTADNIEAFGGDPDRITIWGLSAGSISAYDQALIYRGNNTYKGRPLFRGAIMNSGTAVPTLDVASTKPQRVYDNIVEAAGCIAEVDTLQCLRSVPYNQLYYAMNTIEGLFSYSSLDARFVPRFDPNDDFFPISPSKAGRDGRNVAVVPSIIGDQEDEGTLFALSTSNVTTPDDLITYLEGYFPMASRSQLQVLVDTYPDNPSAGSPFNTGNSNEIYPGFKRNAAVLGDLVFTLARRVVLRIYKTQYPATPLWSYLSSYNDFLPVLGTAHGSDILEVFFGGIPWPEVQNAHLTYYISFINYLDPNKLSGASGSLIHWPQWTKDGLNLLNLLPFSNRIIKDDFRDDSAQVIDSLIDVLAI